MEKAILVCISGPINCGKTIYNNQFFFLRFVDIERFIQKYHTIGINSCPIKMHI